MGISTVQKIQNLVDELETLAELEQIDTSVRQRWSTILKNQATQFKIGDTVAFEDRAGFRHTGKVVAINKKSVRVMVGSTTWSVGPTLLAKA